MKQCNSVSIFVYQRRNDPRTHLFFICSEPERSYNFSSCSRFVDFRLGGSLLAAPTRVQSEVGDPLELHPREKFGDQSRKIGLKESESILVFSGEGSRHYLSFACLLHCQTIKAFWDQTTRSQKTQGSTKYAAVAPALPVGESLPATTAVQPSNSQTIFSPSKQDVDLASIQRQIEDFEQDMIELRQMIVGLEQKAFEGEQKTVEPKQRTVGREQETVERDQEIVEREQNALIRKRNDFICSQDAHNRRQEMVTLKQEMVVLKQETVELEQILDQLNEDRRRLPSDFEQLLNLNTSMLNFELQHNTNHIQVDGIRIRRLINRAPPCSVG